MTLAGNGKRSRLWLAGVGVLVLAGGAYWAAKPGAGASSPSVPAAVPVEVVKALRQDVPHLSEGIGSVQPLQSVTLRPQVDGVLAQVLFREGQQVQKGELLARIDDRVPAASLAQAEAEKRRNEAQLRLAEMDLARYNSLLGGQAVSKQQVQQQEAQVQQLRAAVAASDAAIAHARTQLSFTRITAPFPGRAGMRHVDQGNLVTANSSTGIVTITQMNPISVVFTLPQELLPRLRPLVSGNGISGKDRAAVVAREQGGEAVLARGHLTMIDNQIDNATGTVRLRAEFPNPDGVLWPGQFVTVELQTGNSADAVVLPVRAVRQGLNGSYVFVVSEGKARLTPVTTGWRNDAVVVVASGLEAGAEVVLDGHSRLRDGAGVKVVNAGPVAGAPDVVEIQP